MIKYEFDNNQLSEKAFNIYSNSSFVFYLDNNTFYCALNSREQPFELGDLESVENYLMEFSNED